jgi:general secretion pathway protein D
VTPNINNSGGVAVNVVQEISDVARTTTSGIDSPTFQQRHLESNLSITDGRTVVLGGLISANRTRGRNGVPLLQNVPLLGHLFSSTNNVDQRTELLVFLTPHVQSAADELGSAPPSDAQMPDLSEPPR